MNKKEFKADIENALAVLKKGGIILYPTDTIWGIGCDATNTEAVQRITDIKQRSKNKSFIVLVASEKDVLHYTAAPDLAVFDYLQTVKNPTTVIYEHALGLAENACNEDGSVAIRICTDDFCSHLIKRFRKPIVSTSANFSAQPSPKNFNEIQPEIKKDVDYIVQYKQIDISVNKPSSLIKWYNGKATIIRS